MSQPRPLLSAILPPTIFTDRLLLERFDKSKPSHYDTLLETFNNPTAHATMGDFGLRTHADIDTLIASTRLYPEAFAQPIEADCVISYLVHVKRGPDAGGPGPAIGNVSLAQRGRNAPPDLGWALLEGNTGQGYAAEAARALKEAVLGDPVRVLDVCALPAASNRASCKLAERIGLVAAGTVRLDGSPHDCVVYVLPEGRWRPAEGEVLAFSGDRAEGE